MCCNLIFRLLLQQCSSLGTCHFKERLHSMIGVWWLSGMFGALCLEGCRSESHSSCFTGIELCADVIVSAAARRSISVGGGVPPVPKNRRRGRPKTFFFKIHQKNSFYPQNFLRNFFSHQSFEVWR